MVYDLPFLYIIELFHVFLHTTGQLWCVSTCFFPSFTGGYPFRPLRSASIPSGIADAPLGATCRAPPQHRRSPRSPAPSALPGNPRSRHSVHVPTPAPASLSHALCPPHPALIRKITVFIARRLFALHSPHAAILRPYLARPMPYPSACRARAPLQCRIK